MLDVSWRAFGVPASVRLGEAVSEPPTLLVMTGPQPFQPLNERLAGVPITETLYEGVPEHLSAPLRELVRDATWSREALSRKVRLKLKLEGSPTLAPKQSLLVVLDAILQLHPDRFEYSETPHGGISYENLLAELEEVLEDGGSELRVDRNSSCLVRRVDETVTSAAATAADAATPESRDHLRAAWSAAYGMSPDPDTAYRESVRAVEAAICPLVQPALANAGKATLGATIGELGKNSPHKWEFVIPDATGSPQDVAKLVGMLEMLWQGQVSRHAGGSHNRRQSQPEAEAAVHLGAVLVQWVASGALRRKP